MKYNKEFIITKLDSRVLPSWGRDKIGDYSIISHPKLSIETIETNNHQLMLIGDFFDYRNPSFGNQQILQQLSESSSNIDEVIENTNYLSGVFLLIYNSKLCQSFKILSDAAAQRELYYTLDLNGDLIGGSSPAVISLIHPITLDISSDAVEFYQSKAFDKKKTFITDTSNYKNLKRLKPNHYYDIHTKEMVRFFPCEGLVKNNNIEQVSKKAAKIIQGYLESASNRTQLLVPVSAGWESRVFLSACKNLMDKATFFVFANNNKPSSPDSRIPPKLFRKLGKPFKVVEVRKDLIISQEVEDCIKAVPFFRRKTLWGFQSFLKDYSSSHILINGNISEIARLQYSEIYNPTGKKIAFMEQYPNLRYAVRHYEEWLNNGKKIFLKNGYRILDMLYWEENSANWVAKSKTEYRALGLDVFSPFNSRELIVTLLSVDKKYRRKHNPILYKHIILNLWPDVLQVPVNPDARRIIMKITKKMGVYPLLKNIKFLYQFSKSKWFS